MHRGVARSHSVRTIGVDAGDDPLSVVRRAPRSRSAPRKHTTNVYAFVNNAGAFKMKPAVSMAPRELQLVLDVNVAGAFNCIAAALPYLSRSPRAHIVNVAPPLRTESYWAAGKLAHAVSKFALTTLTRPGGRAEAGAHRGERDLAQDADRDDRDRAPRW